MPEGLASDGKLHDYMLTPPNVTAGSEANAIDVVSTLTLFTGPLNATVDDKKFDVPEGVVLSSTGKTFTIGQS